MSASHSPRLVLFFGAAAVFLSAATACGNGTPATPAPRTASGGSPSAATQQSRTPLSAFATQIAGDSVFYSIGEAESRAGFRVLRVDVAKVPVEKRAEQGFIEVFPEIGLPRVRQSLPIAGHDTILEFVQEPDLYPNSTDIPGKFTSATFGSFTGTLRQWRDQVTFEFLTGESTKGSAIRAIVYSPGGDYTVDDIRHFVEALYFGS